MNKILYFITIGLILILSFCIYSSLFYPLLNSDDALNILMAHYYSLPHDFYCWGQDRGGTLIPLISQIFIKLFGFSALTAVSLSNYFVLILGFIGLSSLLKTRKHKILLAIIWFLPFQRFVDILRFPIGVEYSLIGIAIFLINKINEKNKHLICSVITLILILSIWVSDTSFITISFLFIILILYSYIENKKLQIYKFEITYFFIGLILGVLFIRFAKSFANTKNENYLTINDFNSLKQSVKIVSNSFYKVLTFNVHEVFVSIYSVLTIIFVLFFSITITINKRWKNLIKNKWFSFFFLDFVGILTVIFFSKWVLMNGVGRWYFVASYISFSMVVLLTMESIETGRLTKKILQLYLIIIVIIGAISPVYTMKFEHNRTLKPMVSVVGEFKSLGNIGIIADYWNSYIISCTKPNQIVATPHDKSDIKNTRFITEVFKQKKIFLIKDMWLKTFPDTLKQFGHILLKDGNQFNIGGCDVCKYKKIK